MKITCPNCRARLVVTSPGELRTPHCAPRRNVPDPLEGASLPLPAETIAGDTGESGAVARLPKSVPHPLTTPAEAPPAPEPDEGREKSVRRTIPSQILRFRASERAVHWAIAVPFLVCYTTATILVIFYNPDPQRPLRWVFSWTHRLSAICFIVLPPLVVFRSRGDFRIHLYNIRQAWRWTFNDVAWLAKMGLATISSRFELPAQGKFNAAEKLNFMLVMTTYPLYIFTGILVWLPGVAFLSWVLHFFMAMVATPFLLGHIFMATLNPSTRVGLQGMFSGFVDRQWARHHYSDWYRENFEPELTPARVTRPAPAPAEVPPGAPEPCADEETP